MFFFSDKQQGPNKIPKGEISRYIHKEKPHLATLKRTMVIQKDWKKYIYNYMCNVQ